MATKSKSAHCQATLRQRRREAGLKPLTIWMPKEGADRLARYPEKERGEVVTRALVLLESQGELTGNDTTLTGGLTGESRDEGEAEEDTLTLAGLFTRLERIEAILSTITSNSTGEFTGGSTGKFTGEDASEAISITGGSTDKSTGEVAVTVIEIPSPPVTELTEHPAGLPPKRLAALSRRAKKLSAQGVSWKEIARRFNDEGIQTISGQGRWHGSTVKHMIEKHGRE